MYYCALYFLDVGHKINNIIIIIFRGIGAYYPDFLSIVQLSVFWRTFSVNVLLRKYIIHI